MLTGMDDDLIDTPRAGRAMDGRQLWKVRPSADNVQELQQGPPWFAASKPTTGS
jgi:hypothetical protein